MIALLPLRCFMYFFTSCRHLVLLSSDKPWKCSRQCSLSAGLMSPVSGQLLWNVLYIELRNIQEMLRSWWWILSVHGGYTVSLYRLLARTYRHDALVFCIILISLPLVHHFLLWYLLDVTSWQSQFRLYGNSSLLQLCNFILMPAILVF